MGLVSPGVYSREVDLSLFAERVSTTICGLAHTFNKGPFTRTLVSNISRLQELYGDPINDATACQGWMAAREFLKKGNQLYITRVDSTASPAAYAGMSLQGGTDDLLATIDDGATSIPATKTLTSTATDFGTAGVVIGDVVELHDVSTPADNGFYVITLVAGKVLTVDRNWPTGSLASVSATVWSAKKEGGTDGATSVPATRTFTSAGSTFTTNGVVAGDILYIKDSSTPTDNGMYCIMTVPGETTLTVDRDFPDGSLATLEFVVYSSNSRGSNGSTATAGEFSSAGSQFQLHGIKAGDILYIHDTVDVGNNGHYLITGLKGGSEATTVLVNNYTWAGGVLAGLTYDILPGSIKFTGLTKGTWCTGFKIAATRNAGDIAKFDLSTYDSTGTLLKEKVYAMNRTTVAADMTASSAYFSATVIATRLEPVTGKVFTLSGGRDGYASIVDADYIGNVAAETGLNSFYNSEAVDINVLMCPGVVSQNVQDALISIAEHRGDTFAIIDPPDFPTIDTVQEILDFHNGTNIRTTALNSSYAGLWWTWQEIYDEYHDQNVWCAPSGQVAAALAYTDSIAAPWFAPAGLRRGKMSSISVRYSPDQDDRDILIGTGANVNPICNFAGEGIYIYGQKTLLRTTSALNRVNVRRMLLTTKKIIAASTRYLTFEPNDETLDREFRLLAEPVLKDVMTRRGIREFAIVTMTTDADRDESRARYRMYIKPTKAAEIIELEFVITSQGANFQELLAA